MPAFVIGQRWLSETQHELGLGIVEAVEGRHVRIRYPATGETRLYAQAEAPLARLVIRLGERVRDRSGRELRVIEMHERRGLLVYRGEDDSGRLHELPESELDDRLLYNRPAQRLLAARFDPDIWFGLRYRSWLQGMREAGSPTLGLVGPRIALIPHQLHIAAEVSKREAPRVLLADEVGLGKTIEAGLILHRMRLIGSARRVLILTPEPLVNQWLVEMLRRFNLSFALFDEELIESMEEGNPFLTEQRVLCSLSLLLSHRRARLRALESPWDLLILDEAHHLTWSEDNPSPAYRLVEALAQRAPSVLLLTATPEQLGREGHFGRLRLLDPARFVDLASFHEQERHYAEIAALAERLLDPVPLSGAEQERLEALLGPCRDLDRETLIERLIDHHGTGRILFRNTRAAILGFPHRVLKADPLPEPEAYRALALSDRLTPEHAYGSGWESFDPRVEWLIQTLRALRPDKVLLICAHARTVLELREALRQRAGIHAAVFHEGMEIVERDRAAAYFAAAEEGTQILLCSEIGSEGRNFQFVQHLILFDLPLDPDLLEQRIGRLDRIGQGPVIYLHVPYLAGGPMEVMLRWYQEGLGIFAHPCPAGPEIYERQAQALLETLANPEQAESLIAETRKLAERLNAELAAGRDRLLDLHSHRLARDTALVEAIRAADADPTLAEYLTDLWDAFGVEHEPGPEGSVVLRPGAHMFQEQFPYLPEDGLTATFDRTQALAHEDYAFLTWEHSMVRAAREWLTASQLGTTALILVRDRRFARGTFLLEMLYLAECPAPLELHVDHFLPPTLLRFLLDAEGHDRSAEIHWDSLAGDCLAQNARLGCLVIESQAEQLAQLIERGESLAQGALPDLIQAARAQMEQVLGDEIERLEALAQVNPLVRPDEIARLADRRARLAEQISKTYLRLDALRLIVAY
ncbi:RNA polymerase-associated protein RapA [Caldichromatium japonicum]|uniref:RNA polymerase-associated protein RapA n=1 Tax=Caldichromatium japonicum TaxID=2699430 RepID=A0A6G7VB29_9GAMM|nr:RNA polymerase-associated protein RapA [Caldichromatium japonicum]QIK36997.1 RNA polymerase-associated protein RapA [Caldichromatium japonicum]